MSNKAEKEKLDGKTLTENISEIINI